MNIISCDTFIDYLVAEEAKQPVPAYGKPHILGISLVCCERCHSANLPLIRITSLDERYAGTVCCALWDKVRAIPLEGWIAMNSATPVPESRQADP